MSEFVDIVFDGPPGVPSFNAGQFVEIENDRGESIRFGSMMVRKDGQHVIRITRDDVQQTLSVSRGTLRTVLAEKALKALCSDSVWEGLQVYRRQCWRVMDKVDELASDFDSIANFTREQMPKVANYAMEAASRARGNQPPPNCICHETTVGKGDCPACGPRPQLSTTA